MVNPGKVEKVEMMLLQMAQQGKIREKVSEAKIVQMLEQVAEMDSQMKVETLRTGAASDAYALDGEDDEDPMAKAARPHATCRCFLWFLGLF